MQAKYELSDCVCTQTLQQVRFNNEVICHWSVSLSFLLYAYNWCVRHWENHHIFAVTEFKNWMFYHWITKFVFILKSLSDSSVIGSQVICHFSHRSVFTQLSINNAIMHGKNIIDSICSNTHLGGTKHVTRPLFVDRYLWVDLFLLRTFVCSFLLRGYKKTHQSCYFIEKLEFSKLALMSNNMKHECNMILGINFLGLLAFGQGKRNYISLMLPRGPVKI